MLDRVLDHIFDRDESAGESPQAAGEISVIGYGAKGDGKTDDTDAFNAAIAAASKANGIVRVPAGHYRLRFTVPDPFTAVKLLEGCQLIGEGPDKSILQGLADSVDLSGTTFRLIIAESNTRLAGLTIDGDSQGFTKADFRKKTCVLVRAVECQAAVFEDLVIRNGFSHMKEGFGLSVARSNDCVVRRVEVFGHIGGSGISIDNRNPWKKRPKNHLVEDADCHHNGWQGVAAWAAESVRFVRVRAHENERHGLNCEWSNDVTFEDCESWSNGRRGIRITREPMSRNIVISNVRSWDNGVDHPEGGELLVGLQIFPVADPKSGKLVNEFPDNIQVVNSQLSPAPGKPHVLMDIGSKDSAKAEPLMSRIKVDNSVAKEWTVQAVDAAGADRLAAREHAQGAESIGPVADDL